MHKIKYEHFKNMCRMCMLNCDINFNRNSVMLDIFHKLTDIHFETNDELPQQICLKCFDFINEIHSFSMTCKQTHSALIECLNYYKNKRIKEEQETIEETNKQIEIKDEDEITIEEHKIEFVDCETNELITEDVNNSKNDFITPISTNILAENYEETIHTFNTNDLNNDINSSDNESSTNNKKIAKETIGNEYSSSSESSANSISPRNNKKPKDEQNKCKICIGTSFKLRKHKCDHLSVRKNLKVRKRTHSGRCTYKCDQCEKSFTRLNHLKAHERVHSGERPYRCDQCEKSFSLLSNLKTHKRVHTGERPYKCDLCEKSFVQLCGLTYHKHVHSHDLK